MRDVLVALCGLTPQVITETLWALAHRSPPIYPAEIRILTTQAGRARCRQALIGPTGALARYVREYRPKPAPRCPADHVIVLRGAGGEFLDDVRSEGDSQAVADQIAAFIGQQAQRPDVRLHCSVAGGRKTMGVLLASALQLFGRPEDRLYHVLVPPEFESLDTFFFPPARPVRLIDKRGRRLDTSRARIELAELPYVRLRGLLGSDHRNKAMPFHELVDSANHRLHVMHEPEPVRLGRSTDRIHIGSRTLPLTPAMGTLYRALVRTKLSHCVRPDLSRCGECMECYVPFTKDTWETSKILLERRGGGLLLPKAQGPDDAPEQFRSLVSKLNKKLDAAIGVASGDNPYRVDSAGTKGHTAYGLALDKTKLQEG